MHERDFDEIVTRLQADDPRFVAGLEKVERRGPLLRTRLLMLAIGWFLGTLMLFALIGPTSLVAAGALAIFLGVIELWPPRRV